MLGLDKKVFMRYAHFLKVKIVTKTLFKWSLIKPPFDDRQQQLIKKIFETTLINDVINGARERHFKRRLKGLKMMLKMTLENDVRKRR